MKRDFPWLLVAAAALIAAGTYVVTEILAPWKDKAAKNAGPTLFAQLMDWLHAAEAKYGIPTDLLARQAYQESRFRPDIISGLNASPAGALGLMQIVPKYHPTAEPLNTPAAIDYAARFMAQLRAQFGSWPLALAAYNAGPGNVSKYGNQVPPFNETQNYVAQISADVPSLNA